MSALQLDLAELQAAADRRAAEDLAATPAPAWRVLFEGEAFHGATPAEAFAKAEAFAGELGDSALGTMRLQVNAEGPHVAAGASPGREPGGGA